MDRAVLIGDRRMTFSDAAFLPDSTDTVLGRRSANLREKRPAVTDET